MWNQADDPEQRYKDTTNRTLKLCMTDGRQLCYGMEYQRIPQLSILKTHPGTKVFFSHSLSQWEDQPNQRSCSARTVTSAAFFSHRSWWWG